MTIFDETLTKDALHPNIIPFIDHLIQNSSSSELGTYNFPKDENGIDTGISFKVIPKACSGVQSFLDHHLQKMCDRFSLSIPYAGTCVIKCDIIMNAILTEC